MKQILTLTLGMLCMSSMSSAQNQRSIEEKPYIEVTGKAEKKIIPDEIHLSITIKERTSGKDEISVEEQEKQLKQALEDLNIPLDLLTVADAQADYIKVKWTKKDVISQSEYELKLSTAEQVANVFSKLDEIKINNAYISKVSHSKIKEFQKEVDIEAIKNAKAKADYLLAAIGQQTGTALIINESGSSRDDFYVYGNRDMKTFRNTSFNGAAFDEKSIGAIVFKKIKLETMIYVKFAIN